MAIRRRMRSLPPGHSVVTSDWSASPAAKASIGSDSLPEYTPRLDRVPPGLRARRQFSKVCWVPSASIATSTPWPPVSRRISPTGSVSR